MTEETIRLNREDLKDLKEKGFITRERIADVSKTKRWKPKKGEKCYAIYLNDYIGYYTWTSGSSDNLCFKLGNCFKTKEEAQKDIDRRIAEQELLDMCDYNVDSECAEILYDFENKEFSVGCVCTKSCNSSYRFASKESCQKAIDTLGTEKLKLIFRIED